MLWAENLLLLMTDHRSGRLIVPWTRVDLMLAGSLLDEFSQAGLIALERPDRPRRPGKITVVADPAGDYNHPVVRAALASFGGRPRRPTVALQRVKKDLRTSLYTSLEHRGLVTRRRGRMLGFVPITEYPVASLVRPDDLAPRVTAWWDAATQQATTAAVFPAVPRLSNEGQRALADVEATSAVALIEAINAVRPVVKRLDLNQPPRDLRKVAAEQRKRSWAAMLVRNVLQSQQAAAASSSS